MPKIKKISKNVVEINGERFVKAKESTYNFGKCVRIPNTDMEVEVNVHHKNKSYNDLKAEFGEDFLKEHLINLKLLGEICENPKLLKTLKMDSSSTKDDFFIKQPFPQNEARNYVAWFVAYSVDAGLYCYGYSGYSVNSLGVRFARKISKTAVKKKS